MQEELGERDDVLILAINSGDDSRAEVAQHWANLGYDFAAVVDPPGGRGQLNQVLGAIAYPTNIVVDPDGIVLHASYGFSETRIRELLDL
jgi:hypothetical protein